MSNGNITRRDALQMAAAPLLLSAAASAEAAKEPVAKIPLAFDDPRWNRDAMARLQGNLDPAKFVYGSAEGMVLGVRDAEKVQPLFRFEVFSTNRVLRQPDGSFQRLNRELVFYRDLQTHQIMEQWLNSYTNETVRVVPVANDPFNYMISDTFPDPPSYGGLNKEKPPKRPFLLKWGHAGKDIVTLETDIHLLYPSALQPEKWPRESPGKMSRVSEMFRYFIPRAELEDPRFAHVSYVGTWSRITPWLPWMLMDQAPGHICYYGQMMSRASLDEYPKDLIDLVKARYSKYLVAPEEWSGPSLSSLERYALEQQPAAPRAK